MYCNVITIFITLTSIYHNLLILNIVQPLLNSLSSHEHRTPHSTVCTVQWSMEVEGGLPNISSALYSWCIGVFDQAKPIFYDNFL